MKKIVSYLPLLFGLYVLTFWTISSLQFLHYYYTYGKFDLNIAEFLIFMVPIFTPFVTLGSLLVSYYIKRLRLYLWMRKNLAIAEYDIDMPPAEAGIVVDYFFSTNEVVATLLDLHFRGIIKMDIRGASIQVELLKDDYSNLSVFEAELVEQIFMYEKHRSFNTCNDKYLKDCGRLAYKKLMDWADKNNTLMSVIPKRAKPLMPYLLIMAFIGFLISLLSIWVLVFDYQSATTLGPNTYPVYPIELIIVYGISLWGLIILLSSFWPRFSNNHKSKPVATWVKTYGLKIYLKSVHSERFSQNNVAKQPKPEINKYAPYMIAFNLSPCSTTYLAQVLKEK